MKTRITFPKNKLRLFLRGAIAMVLLFLVGLISVNIVSASGGELVVNGGFEEPAVASGSCAGNYGTWALCSNGQVPGWTATSVATGSPAYIELSSLGDAGFFPHSGDQKTELDSNQAVRISQQITTVPGKQYLLTYFWHWRTSSDVLEVRWDGNVLATYSTAGVPFAWHQATHIVTASTTSTELAFAEIGPSNSFGPYVDDVSVVLNNTPPTANAGGPYLGAVDASIQFDGSGSSDPDGDALTYSWNFGDSNSSNSVMPNHSYNTAGIFDVCLTVNDGTIDSEPACTIAVIYDPEGGFVTGGGRIDSPVGAFKADENLTGNATFGFVSKYKKGATIPTGNTEFHFQAGDFNFHSDSYGWLVVNQDGTNAQFKGVGTINGALDANGNTYKFMLWAGDGSPDTFRIKVWSEDDQGNEQVVYDNGTDQPIGGGSIVVHQN